MELNFYNNLSDFEDDDEEEDDEDEDDGMHP